MQESHGKGPASHPTPSDAGGREAGSEALILHQGWWWAGSYTAGIVAFFKRTLST
jgi:hypothetical protein